MGALRQKVDRLLSGKLSYRRDDLTATAGDATITLASWPQGLMIFKNGSLMSMAGYSVTGLIVSLSIPLSGGDLISVGYWSNGTPGASTLSP